MSSLDSDSKLLARKVKDTLKDLGYDLPLGHAYELLAKVSGYKSWNVASKATNFIPTVGQKFLSHTPDPPLTVETGNKAFEVYLQADAVIEKSYVIQAKDEAEAKKIIDQYHDFQMKENGGYFADYDQMAAAYGQLPLQAQELVEREDDGDFLFHWKIWSAKKIEVSGVYDAYDDDVLDVNLLSEWYYHQTLANLLGDNEAIDNDLFEYHENQAEVLYQKIYQKNVNVHGIGDLLNLVLDTPLGERIDKWLKDAYNPGGPPKVKYQN